MTGAPPEAAFYQTIEEFFVSRRGDPLLLSSADWMLIRKWRRQGIPLRIVLRGIADALDSHAHSWNRGQKVGSLAYCAAEVQAARQRWERALATGGAPDGPDLANALLGFAAALETASLSVETAAVARRLAGELRQRAAQPLDGTERLEAWLGALEAELLALLRQDPARVAEAEAEADADLAPYRGRMPEKVLRQVREESLTRRLLQAHGLPRLSLFHLS